MVTTVRKTVGRDVENAHDLRAVEGWRPRLTEAYRQQGGSFACGQELPMRGYVAAERYALDERGGITAAEQRQA